jgi:hypothetical protein
VYCRPGAAAAANPYGMHTHGLVAVCCVVQEFAGSPGSGRRVSPSWSLPPCPSATSIPVIGSTAAPAARVAWPKPRRGLQRLLQRCSPQPLPPLLSPLAGVVAVAMAVGSSHTCVIALDNGVKCWGSNGFGQLGIGNKTDQNLPADVPGGVKKGKKDERQQGSSPVLAATIAGGSRSVDQDRVLEEGSEMVGREQGVEGARRQGSKGAREQWKGERAALFRPHVSRGLAVCKQTVHAHLFMCVFIHVRTSLRFFAVRCAVSRA